VSIRRNVLSVLLVAAAIVGCQFPPAGAATQSASSHHVVATFSYSGSAASSRDLHLVIRVDGVIRYDAPVVARFCGSMCSPDFLVSGRPVVHVVNLGRRNRRDVVLDLFSGGAHCCTIERVYEYDVKTRTYLEFEHDFGDPSAPLVDLARNGRYEFVSADDTFAYRFTDFAASGLPIEVVAFANHRFNDVTRHYRGLVADDARKWMLAFRGEATQHFSDSVGLVAAWAADEDLLGHGRLVHRFLVAQAAAGHLNDGLGDREPSGRAFVITLDHFLVRRGYLP
jgi:hypothetical protein